MTATEPELDPKPVELTADERRLLHDGVCSSHRDTVPGVYVCKACEYAGDAAVEKILAARLAALVPEGAIILQRPQIHTGPKHMTVDEATADYLRDAAGRVRKQRYWGSGVTALVSDLLDSAALAIETSAGVR